ncbi:MAG: hypothetical protein PHF86_09135 [Candidatus Nanoarchaeia archaeon]|nr:hypothetical protein [Candidatus Nanoarchaeia archaeon]
MKKGIFLPMLALFTIVIISVIGLMFYERTINDKSKLLGEKSGEVINTIINREKLYFGIQEAAKLAYCDSLNDISQKYNIDNSNCIQNDFPIWDFTPTCNPENINYEEILVKNFKNNFDSYLPNELFGLKYNIKLVNNGFSFESDSVNIEDNKDFININYLFFANYTQEIDSNQKDYGNLIKKVKNYKNCLEKTKNIDTCNVENQLDGKKSDNLIKFEVPSIKNPCTLQEIKIKFAIFA